MKFLSFPGVIYLDIFRSGEATAIHARRNQTLHEAFIKNPLRWRRRKVRSYQCNPVFAFYRPVKKAA